MRKNKKGMTVVEVVVSFTLISLSFAIGMVGIGSGANYLNAGAKLKKTRSNLEAVMTDTSEVTVVVQIASGTTTYTVTEYSSDNFKRYEVSP